MECRKLILAFTLVFAGLIANSTFGFSQRDSNPRLTTRNGLPGNHVRTFSEDSEGKLWIGTAAGIATWDGETMTTLTEEVRPTSLYFDSQDRMWAGTKRGFKMWDGQQWIGFDSVAAVPQRRVDEIFEDSHGNIWFGGRGGLSRLAGEQWTHYAKTDGLGHSRVFSIAEDSSGKVYFGHFGGVVSTYGPDSKWALQHFGSAAYLTWVSMGILVGTIGISAYFYPPVAINLIPVPLIPIGLHARLRTQVEFDLDGNYWVGNSGKSLLKNPDTNRVRYRKGKFKALNLFYDLMTDSKGNLWLGSARGGSVFNGIQWVGFQPSLAIFEIFEDSQGRIWLATRKGAISK